MKILGVKQDFDSTNEDVKQDLSLNILSANKDFCSNIGVYSDKIKDFWSNILGAKNDFSSNILNWKKELCSSTLGLKHDICSNLLGAKQDVDSTIEDLK